MNSEAADRLIAVADLLKSDTDAATRSGDEMSTRMSQALDLLAGNDEQGDVEGPPVYSDKCGDAKEPRYVELQVVRCGESQNGPRRELSLDLVAPQRSPEELTSRKELVARRCESVLERMMTEPTSVRSTNAVKGLLQLLEKANGMRMRTRTEPENVPSVSPAAVSDAPREIESESIERANSNEDANEDAKASPVPGRPDRVTTEYPDASEGIPGDPTETSASLHRADVKAGGGAKRAKGFRWRKLRDPVSIELE